MVMNYLLNTIWLGPCIWAALFFSDYYLTLHCAQLYRDRVREKLVFEGSYELTPYYQQDIDSLRLVSPRGFFWCFPLYSVFWPQCRRCQNRRNCQKHILWFWAW